MLANASLADTESVNLAQPDGTTVLFWAAWRNDTAAVDLLLSAGADVNVVNDYGATALYVAAENADGPVVSKLLDANADPNKALLSGETPLMQAARRGKLDVVRLLLSKGADPQREGIEWRADRADVGDLRAPSRCRRCTDRGRRRYSGKVRTATRPR